VARLAQPTLIYLELLRFFAACTVLVWHYQHFAYSGLSAQELVRQAQPFYDQLQVFYDHGHYAVQLFWAVSGYIFFYKYPSLISARLVSGRDFFMRRFSRLYPLHLLTLVIVAGLQFLYWKQTSSFFVYPNNDGWHFVLQLALASNWSPSFGYSFNGPIWSVSVEVLVYALFFAAMRVSSALWIHFVILAASFIGVYFLPQWLFFQCALLFFVGGLAALARPLMQQTVLHRCGLLPLVGLALLLGGMLILARFADVVLALPSLIWGACIFILLFCLGAEPGSWQRTWFGRLCCELGNMTYASYLLHFPLQLGVALVFVWLDQSIPYRSYLLFWGYLLACLILAFVVYRLFERPMQDWIRRRLQDM
jgi:peptidoglycan/LPS O-acetylase OafA/YrhL